MRRSAMAVMLAGLLAALPAAAGEIALDREPVQGALVTGTLTPANGALEVDGRPVQVAGDGRFVFGLDRDADERAELVVEWPDGERLRRALDVGSRDYEIQRIDGLPPSKVTPSEDDLQRIRREAAMVREARRRDDPRTDFTGDWRWPLHGTITGVYGSQRILNGEPRRPHYGIDIAAPTGTPVVAPADGVVTLVHEDMFFSGGTLLLDHGHGVSSAFLHLSDIHVAEGERVRQGRPLPRWGLRAGSPGRISTGG
ncbi:MAG: M23 family metallopeptidase [Arhodomonas sp.]|nr:M23 family metallopeptidase [Arhodomonas sp.]